MQFNPEIGIWYTVWWDNEPPFDSHWTEWTRYRPVLGDYATDDSQIIEAHMKWIKEAGIDFAILDDTNGHHNDNGNIAEHIDKIFQVVEAMPEGTAPKLALAFGHGQWGSNNPQVHQEEADLIYERYAQSPVFYHWKGKPLLINYTTPSWFSKWDDDRFTVRRATGKVSEGAAEAPETGLWGWVFDQHVPNIEVRGVTPGWGTAHLGRGTIPIPREGGNYYVNLWLQAIKENPEVVVISSFNDFAEETAIEAASPRDDQSLAYTDYYGQEVPDWYEQLTKGYAGLKKNGFLDGFYYQEEGEKSIYQYTNDKLIKVEEIPQEQPVIVVPKGFINEK